LQGCSCRALRTGPAAYRDRNASDGRRRGRIGLDEVAGDKNAGIPARAYVMPADVITAANEAMNLTGTANE
jgi:hypothetical protein